MYIILPSYIVDHPITYSPFHVTSYITDEGGSGRTRTSRRALPDGPGQDNYLDRHADMISREYKTIRTERHTRTWYSDWLNVRTNKILNLRS